MTTPNREFLSLRPPDRKIPDKAPPPVSTPQATAPDKGVIPVDVAPIKKDLTDTRRGKTIKKRLKRGDSKTVVTRSYTITPALWDAVVKFCSDQNVCLSAWLRLLIMKDLEARGYWKGADPAKNEAPNAHR